MPSLGKVPQVPSRCIQVLRTLWKTLERIRVLEGLSALGRGVGAGHLWTGGCQLVDAHFLGLKWLGMELLQSILNFLVSLAWGWTPQELLAGQLHHREERWDGRWSGERWPGEGVGRSFCSEVSGLKLLCMEQFLCILRVLYLLVYCFLRLVMKTYESTL